LCAKDFYDVELNSDAKFWNAYVKWLWRINCYLFSLWLFKKCSIPFKLLNSDFCLRNFYVGKTGCYSDHVFLRVASTTGVGRAIKSRKLTPKFIGPYQILRRIGPVAYQIALPPFLSNIHDVFYVSQLRKYISDPSHIIEPDIVPIEICSIFI
jgi:hypothetical protein